MSITFGSIPDEVVEFVRSVFGNANDKVSCAISQHPSLHEEMLDHILVTELAATPPTFFAASRAAIAIETHWLGGRWMHHRWEVADIAIFVSLRHQGQLVVRKVALLQTKRLYSHELAGTELTMEDYMFGIGRLADRIDPQVPLSRPRQFRFDEQSRYQQLRSDTPQVRAINEYEEWRGIPVYYGFYNPVAIPYTALYPATPGTAPTTRNDVGCRIAPADRVHALLEDSPPAFAELEFAPPFIPAEPWSSHGWRLEGFVADEVLKCRQGRLFEETRHEDLQALLYARAAPISSAIAITIDFDGDVPE
jgi:hypothetical protein